ncbi:response regulator [Paraburkholderia sp. MMS20-SJTR3]|uniref:histidine kinase n=1 Tax=Paraburkholderia sejongensis TaxID=2886946 RepID=A0ABS8K6B9_9BURK|nr:ATP-binding protein [Paraburkholderia sp. MMS20-SJTR3]MCC8397688.1 response regulator [Paraburkholderia sp. MMS20-SJTR3]
MRAEIDARQHELTLVLPQALTIEGDAIRLEQIVTNLLGNAAKYTPAGGRIELKLVRNGEEAVLTVTDNGIGMTADFLPTIFTLFVQAERPLDRASAGLGLGLALVHKLVGLHHGTVHASSPGLGRGSTFVIRLPAPHGLIVPQPLSEDVTGDTALTVTHKILVVDDNADAADSTAMILQLEGHEVKVASNGPAALQYATEFRPGVILLDIGLPDMDGYEIAHRIRAIAGLAHTVLIAVSGYAGEDHRERARQAGFDHYLVKPAGLSRLNELIATSRGDR